MLPPVRAEKPLALVNGGFEDGLTGWTATVDNGMSAVAADAAHAGKSGLRVTDGSKELGSSLGSTRLPAVAGKTYEVRCQARVINGGGIGVYLRFIDAKGNVLNTAEKKNQHVISLAKKDSTWQAHAVSGVAPADAVQVEVWIHSYLKNTVTAEFDEIALVEL
jgi:hypothetical protein